ncbi:MAG: carotenoid 1,2-hydratase [Burkholderiaceae bacterium]|nr:carotenoid 1,2-hydratase [Burkholderiaceae bacterium]
MAPGGYLWWYVDAVSDDGRHALTVIAFVGSVFSPYYRRAFHRDPMTDPLQHCAINVALYGDARRWTMTERAARHVRRSASEFVVGPSRVRWDGGALCLDLDEVGMPWPRRVRGRVRVWPHGLARWRTTLDAGGAHRWGPIAPCARAEVELDAPALRWQGEAYVDSNDGDEPIERPFADWDWSRATLADGSTAVIYDVRERGGAGRVIAQRFATHGQTEAFEPPPRQRLPRTGWRVARQIRSDAPARVNRTLEDTPFYARSLLDCGVLGQRVQAVHESLSLPRLQSPLVQWMLPWRMPRRR